MNNKIYNEEEQKQTGMIRDLKKLPKIKAPENFEFNLMTRINNKNFGNAEHGREKFNWLKFLAPSAAVVTAVILFFIFLPSNEQIDNSFTGAQKMIDSQSITGNSNAAGNELMYKQGNMPDAAASKNSQIETRPKAVTPPLNSLRLPFGYSRSVSLDDYIRGGNNSGDMQRGNVVNSGDSETPFDGFFVVEKPDQNTLKKERARIDSLKNAKNVADSLKKIQKLP
ncbi:MAG: hypothetical protein WC061_10100 [Melioribacteraceae bacterium]